MVDIITMMDFYFFMGGVLFIYLHERYYNYETMNKIKENYSRINFYS
jgi:hypothetical protein